MADRVEFELSDEEFAAILDASRPVPYIVVGGVEPRTSQQNANAAWQRLAAERGFKWDTVRPGRDDRHFTAEVEGPIYLDPTNAEKPLSREPMDEP
jgi:predicted TIM-barrel fold metal-dependent hydrolase